MKNYAVLDEKSDQQWAREMGLSIEEFRGEIPYDPIPDLSHLPCGQDDAVGDRINANKQMIYLRRKWADSGSLLPFKGYVRMHWQEGYWVEPALDEKEQELFDKYFPPIEEIEVHPRTCAGCGKQYVAGSMCPDCREI